MPRKMAKKPTQRTRRVARAVMYCCDAQNPRATSKIPITRPNHHTGLIGCAITEWMMSKAPLMISRSPKAAARDQKAL